MNRIFYLFTVTTLVVPEPATFVAAGILVAVAVSALACETYRIACDRRPQAVGM